jgi:hypothetical protein
VPVSELDRVRSAGAQGPRVRGAAARSLLLIVTLGALIALSAWSLASALPASRAETNAARNGALSDDDAGTALFALTALVPGETQLRCIRVSNDGPALDGIRLVGSAEGGDLREFLRFSLDAGSGGRFGDCSGFAGTRLFDGSLAQFVALHHDYDSGLVTSTPTQTGSTTFRLRVTLDDVPAAQGETATVSFACGCCITRVQRDVVGDECRNTRGHGGLVPSAAAETGGRAAPSHSAGVMQQPRVGGALGCDLRRATAPGDRNGASAGAAGRRHRRQPLARAEAVRARRRRVARSWRPRAARRRR